jgi:rhodanese-related sulfurtransferase
MTSKNSIAKDIKGSVILVFFALATAFLYNSFSPFGIPLKGQWETGQGVVSANSENDSVNASIEINSPQMILDIVQKKQRIIIDVRPREAYDQGHLPSALSFPLMEFDQGIGQILESINRQTPLLIYCSSFECTDSHTFAQQLIGLKYENVRVFSGGFRQWQEKEYEIEKNET